MIHAMEIDYGNLSFDMMYIVWLLSIHKLKKFHFYKTKNPCAQIYTDSINYRRYIKDIILTLLWPGSWHSKDALVEWVGGLIALNNTWLWCVDTN